MKFNIGGDIIATSLSHDKLIRLVTVPDGLKIATLQPFKSSDL